MTAGWLYPKKIIKDIKFKIDYRGYSILDASSGNESIKNTVLSEKPAMIARCGATEMRCVGEYLATGSFSETIKREIFELSGVFPAIDSFLKKFCEHYMECVGQSEG